MKKFILLGSFLIAGFLFFGFVQDNAEKSQQTPQDETFQIPADVQKVLDNSCTGCHSSESNNTKAKMKLKFDEMGSLKTFKLSGKLSDIAKEIEEDKMPPSKAIEKYPEMKLSAEDKALVVNWAKETAAKLAGE
ncbi:MAG TPA: heme-binding domain-containing protein [Bacteroidales bacterium]